MEELLRTHFVGTNELRKHLTELLHNLRKEGEELVVTKQGKPVAVILDVEKYLEIQETLREFSDPAYLAELLEAKKEFAEGKGIAAEKVYEEKGL
ncbi:MAG: type II toxin-antitoxin system Phd/YefM family antitoxin [Chloroflexi bacterium]|nr:type II toxin-antitoxin system Phd/YefM family antitoxin [Chloroflexota bacterium]